MLLKAAQNSHSLSPCLVQRKRCSRLWRRDGFSAREGKIEWFDSRNYRLGEWTLRILERRCSGSIHSCWRDSILFIYLFWANWHWKLFPSSTYVFFFPNASHTEDKNRTWWNPPTSLLAFTCQKKQKTKKPPTRTKTAAASLWVMFCHDDCCLRIQCLKATAADPTGYVSSMRF